MGDSFFAAAAQVLPTLFIALVIEFGLLSGLATRRQMRFSRSSFLVRLLLGRRALAEVAEDAEKEFAMWQKRFWTLGTIFLIGEILSFEQLLFDSPTWVSWIAAAVVFFCVLRVASAVAFMPAVRFVFAQLDQVTSGKSRDTEK